MLFLRLIFERENMKHPNQLRVVEPTSVNMAWIVWAVPWSILQNSMPKKKPLPAHLPQSGGCFVPKTAAPILPKAVADFDTSSVRFSWRGQSIFSRTVFFFGNGDCFPGLHARVSLEVLPSFKNKCNPIFPVKIFSQEPSDFPEVHAIFA